MAQISQMELNSIREVVSGHQTMSAKFATYAEQCQDQHIKQMFKKAATDSQNSAQKLLQML